MTWQTCFVVILLTSFLAQSVVTASEDAVWTDWLEWTPCSVTCGSGYHVRSRVCGDDVTSVSNCTGDAFEVKSCHINDCPINGGWGAWLSWSPCSFSCGTGVRYRSRNCDNPAPSSGGAQCVGKDNDFGTCNLTHCPVDGSWADWSGFGACSETCGFDAFKTRVRNCSNPEPAFGGKTCDGNSTDTLPCNFTDCKDGTWEEWQPWGDCSKTCGTSVQLRNRVCQLSSTNGTCLGNYYEFKSCSSVCPVDGNWTAWSEWGRCSATCESGTKTRTRLCANPSPAHGGQNCSGNNTETLDCFVSVVCPINGNWASWQPWSQCDKTCGNGTRVRLRDCTNPAPKFNGTDCVGDLIESDSCLIKLCPLNGKWSNWYSWESCSVSCGVGTQSRIRLCTNPKPANGGLYCVGDYEDLRNCSNTDSCPVDGGWASWAAWGACSVTCGTGDYSRNRTCTQPAPHDGGKPCTGNSVDHANCTSAISCPIDGGWAAWRDLTPCSVTCGNGTQTRGRTCTNPRPQQGGTFCTGDNTVDEVCVQTPCDDGSLAEVVG